MTMLVLLGCRTPVIGMHVVVDVSCTGPDGACTVGELGAPCRCNPNRFDRPSGRVGVWDEVLDDAEADPEVVFTLDYTGDERSCGRDGVVFDEPVGVSSLVGDPLYAIDVDSSLVLDPSAPVEDASLDNVTFAYPSGAETVHETHTVQFRDAMDLVPYAGIPCCATVRPTGFLPVVIALFAARRRGRDRARGTRRGETP